MTTTFGGSPGEVLTDRAGNIRAGTTATFWTAETGGTQITGLTDWAALALPANTATAEAGGKIKVKDPADRLFLWVEGSASGGVRFRMSAHGVDGSLSDLYAPKVARIADLPTPFYLAHRGGLSVYPENTREAFRGASALGVDVLETDVIPLSDGAGAIHHDATVDRTTAATGDVANFSSGLWQTLTFDTSSWFLPSWPNLTAPMTIDDLCREFGGKRAISAEAKLDPRAGKAILAATQAYGLEDSMLVCSFVDSFIVDNCLAAGLICAFVDPTLALDPAAKLAQGYSYLIFDHTLVADAAITAAIAAGQKMIPYTVNRRVDRDRMLALGCVGFITDEPAYLKGDGSWRRTTDPFGTATYYHGQRPGNWQRGSFSGGKLSLGTEGGKAFLLQGWAGEVENKAATYQIAGTWTYDALGSDAANWAAAFFACPTDAAYTDNGVATENGYLVLLRVNGQMTLYKRINGVATQLATVTGAAISAAAEVPFDIDVTPTQITVTRTDVGVNNVVTAANAERRGGYFHLGRLDAFSAGLRVSISAVAIT